MLILKVVGIDKVLAGVVGRVDIDELDFARVGFLQELEDFEIVALDYKVEGDVPVHAVLRAWTQGSGRGGEGELPGAALAMPIESVLLLPFVYRATEKLLEDFEVHFSFDQDFREKSFWRRSMFSATTSADFVSGSAGLSGFIGISARTFG